MDIEHLTKTQIVLLCLLCTFVASIATGIVTVALLAQAPPAVTQTVNHVIQRTVETVVPDTKTPTTVKETTVVVKEDELLSNTISNAFSKLGVVHQNTSTTSDAIGLGVPVGNFLITDTAIIVDKHVVEFGVQAYQYEVHERYPEVGVAVLKLVGEKGPTSLRIADTTQVKLGQSVVAIPSASGVRVGIGAVTARYTMGRIAEGGETVAVRALDTNIGGRITPGAPLLNAFGDVLGVSTGVSQGPAGGVGTFVSASDLSTLFLGVRGTSTPPVSVE